MTSIKDIQCVDVFDMLVWPYLACPRFTQKGLFMHISIFYKEESRFDNNALIYCAKFSLQRKINSVKNLVVLMIFMICVVWFEFNFCFEFSNSMLLRRKK